MKKSLSVTLAILALFLVSSSGLVATQATSNAPLTAANSHASKEVELNVPPMGGLISNAGDQKWTISGGDLMGAQLGTYSIASGDLSFYLHAKVTGLSATGEFKLSLKGVDTTSGSPLRVHVEGSVIGMVPLMCFPSYSQPDQNGNCATGSNSAIPSFFLVQARVTISQDSGDSASEASSPTMEVLMVEAPILNPFGGPIVISSTDKVISIEATYDHGHAHWQNVQLMGTLSGTLEGQSVSGSFVQAVDASENFVTGVESEHGTIAFMDMAPASLNGEGIFHGSSTVPSTGSYDCSTMLGLPEGTCTATGLHSTGRFGMTMDGASATTDSKYAHGTYVIDWPAPSVMFSGTISLTMGHHEDQLDSNAQH